MVQNLVTECSQHGDQRMYRAVISVVANRVTIPPMVQPTDGKKTAETTDPAPLLAGFAALGGALAEKMNGQRRRERT
ncbi:hypothetical protein [Streptomyces brevispora]|uniref:hypothetical protein n=1 Tax=Streptomyces brevispora TaxID=887462 RepID=UPI0035E15F70